MTAVTLNQSFEKDITDILIKYRGVQSSIDNTKISISEIEDKIKELECEKSTLKLCKPIIDDIISKFSDSLLRRLEELLTIGLKKIFYDRNYSIQIRVVDKRNTKCVELLLNDNGNLIPVKNANVAGGVLVVIAAIIQVFYIINIPTVDKYLFLDEQFSQVSQQYVGTFMDFIKTLCSETGLSIVLITHDNKFIQYGDRIYIADKGKFSLQSSEYAEE
jgi:DNA repair exonuclease SbcCD ATPase subunit